MQSVLYYFRDSFIVVHRLLLQQQVFPFRRAAVAAAAAVGTAAGVAAAASNSLISCFLSCFLA